MITCAVLLTILPIMTRRTMFRTGSTDSNNSHVDPAVDPSRSLPELMLTVASSPSPENVPPSLIEASTISPEGSPPTPDHAKKPERLQVPPRAYTSRQRSRSRARRLSFELRSSSGEGRASGSGAAREENGEEAPLLSSSHPQITYDEVPTPERTSYLAPPTPPYMSYDPAPLPVLGGPSRPPYPIIVSSEPRAYLSPGEQSMEAASLGHVVEHHGKEDKGKGIDRSGMGSPSEDNDRDDADGSSDEGRVGSINRSWSHEAIKFSMPRGRTLQRRGSF